MLCPPGRGGADHLPGPHGGNGVAADPGAGPRGACAGGAGRWWGTPLATAIDTARQVVEGIMRSGRTPVVVFMTDARANLSREGQPAASVPWPMRVMPRGISPPSAKA